MAQNPDQIIVAAGGAVYVSPVGTAAPVDETVAWPAGWIELGFTTEEGVKGKPSQTLKEFRGWQSQYALRRIKTQIDLVVSFTLMQFGREQVRLAFGGGTVVETSDGHYRYKPPPASQIDERQLGIEWADNAKRYRLIVPRGLVTELGEFDLSRENPVQLPVSFGLTFDPLGGGGDPWYVLTNDPNWEG